MSAPEWCATISILSTDSGRTRNILLGLYREYITEQINELAHPNLILLKERLVKLGYQSGITLLQEYAMRIRDKLVKKAVIRFETMLAQQAQVNCKEDTVNSRG